VAVILLAVAGQVLHLSELVIAAAAGGALVGAAVLYVRLTRVNLEASRALKPPRLHAGIPGDVEITVRNTSTRTTPSLAISDPFASPTEPTRRWARFRLAPLHPGQAVRASYELDGQVRGVYELGPLEVRLEDPFGLASTLVAAAPVSRLVVYPAIEPLEPLSPGLGSRYQLDARPIAHAAAVDGELYTLREYHTGDDLRRVHWRSTAKRDEVMIRHDDVPRQNAATVVLDLRDEAHTVASLERAVSAAASIVHAAWRRGWSARLVTTDGTDSGVGTGHAHVEAILERLASARAALRPSPAALAVPVDNRGRAGMAAVVTTGAGMRAEPIGLRHRSGVGVLVLVDGAGAPGGRRMSAPGTRVVHTGVGQPLARAWAAAMGGASNREPARR